jgi:hypothetical protein
MKEYPVRVLRAEWEGTVDPARPHLLFFNFYLPQKFLKNCPREGCRGGEAEPQGRVTTLLEYLRGPVMQTQTGNSLAV